MKNKNNKNDTYFMSQALKEAHKAQKLGEVPIGAVITFDNKIIARGFNKCIILSDPTAHAEIVALRRATKKLKNYRLSNCSMYATIEPCAMCVGALVNARIKKIVFGTYDEKSGACKSAFKMAKSKKLNHKIEFKGGKAKYLSKESADIIKNFFKEKRKETNEGG